MKIAKRGGTFKKKGQIDENKEKSRTLAREIPDLNPLVALNNNIANDRFLHIGEPFESPPLPPQSPFRLPGRAGGGLSIGVTRSY